MSLNLTKQDRIYKKLFTFKPPQRDGLIVNVHHTDKNSQKIRFIHTCFDKTGHTLAFGDNEGTIFIIDCSTHKFWNLPKAVTSCSIIRFSVKEDEILIGAKNGNIAIINVQTGHVVEELAAHEYPVTSISFANDFLCLTASISEAVLWNLKTNTKVQVLNLYHNCTLKYVSFIPVTNDIVTCFNDDLIQIWQFGTYEVKNQIPPLVWFSHEVKNITFTLDGKIMVIGCRTPHLALFLLSNFKLLKFITLPEYILTLKHVEFIPQMNDGGSNKIIAVLSGRGSVYFYDVEQNMIISELVASFEISKFQFSNKGSLFVCTLCSGEVNIYDVTRYILVPIKLRAVRADTPGRSVRLKRYLEKTGVVKEKIRDILEIEKLRKILKECGEYPDSYRMKIWEHLLELPNNKEQYNAIINNRMVVSFEDLCRKYPLQNKKNLKNLKQLLDNLVTWCPFFLHLDYLPLFVFPFVKMFSCNPVACFEAVCTIIVNWCQYWFEYFPLPPVNILSMIENILMEHDSELLDFFTKKNVSPEVYAWPILRTIFSEVLIASSWKIFWDHVLTNEPSFLLCGIVSYNILQRTALLKLKEEKQFQCFFNTFHPIDVKKLLAKTYHILAKTSETIHPRQYLSLFKKIKPGEYPDFCDYPKTIIEVKTEKSDVMKQQLKDLKSDEINLFKRHFINLQKLENVELQQEENNRIIEIENAIRKQLQDEQDRVQHHYEKLTNLRHQFQEEDEVLGSLQTKLAKQQQRSSRKKYLSTVLGDIQFRKKEKDYAMTKVEDDLLYHYSELLKNKYKIEKLLENHDLHSSEKEPQEPTIFEKHQQQLAEEISFVSKIDKSHEYLKNLNLATGIAAMDSLIKKVETELDNEKRGVVTDSVADKRVLQLRAETKELATEVNNLVQMLVDLRRSESG